MIKAIGGKVTLSNGVEMPGFGYGCYKVFGDELVNAINAAWDVGYRLFDTAAFYRNEETVGQALAAYNESEFFLISKIWPTDFDNPAKAFEESLKKLGRDYLDGFLLHWPGTNEKNMLLAYEAMLQEREKGKIRALGVSNFLQCHLMTIQREFGRWPEINQIEVHPVFQQSGLCQFCKERGIEVMAWSPLGRGRTLDDPVLQRIGQAYGKSPAQVVLRWHIQQERVPIPKSAHVKRVEENADVFDFSLTDADLRAIGALEKGVPGRTGKDPMTFSGV